MYFGHQYDGKQFLVTFNETNQLVKVKFFILVYILVHFRVSKRISAINENFKKNSYNFYYKENKG